MIDFEAPSSKDAILAFEDPATRTSLLKFGISLMQSDSEGGDLLSNAMACACDPQEGRPWDRAMGTFGAHMRTVLRDLARRDRTGASKPLGVPDATGAERAKSQATAQDWTAAEKILFEEEDRVAALSDEDFAREMRALPEPLRVPSVKEVLGRAGARTIVSTLPPRPNKVPVVVWLIAAALGMVLVVFVLERPDRSAAERRGATGASTSENEATPTSSQQAQKLRRDAVTACAQGLFAACEGNLNEARELDPAGESEPVVQQARKSVRDGMHPDPGRR
jgi:hypothetical protein